MEPLERLVLAIDGTRYDVTAFAADHPGGPAVLRQMVGRDASAAFAENHSGMRARALLDGMPLVADDDGTDAALRAATERAAAVPPDAASALPLWSVAGRGFLPTRDPIARCAALAPLERCAALLPTACIERNVKDRVDRESAAIAALLPLVCDRGALSDGELERAHALYGYVATAYVRASDRGGRELDAVPSFLARGWCAVSAVLGRKPMVDYADCVLHNWERVDPTGAIEIDNIRMLLRFTGLVDEEWFFKVHVVIEAAAASAVSALREGAEIVAGVTESSGTRSDHAGAVAAPTAAVPATFAFGASDDDALGRHRTATQLLLRLNALSDSLSVVVRRYLPKMFEQDPRGDGPMCDFYMFFHRLRPFIKSWDKVYEGVPAESDESDAEAAPTAAPAEAAAAGDGAAAGAARTAGAAGTTRTPTAARHYCGPSGAMSSLLPAVDAFVGISMTNARLARTLAEFETYAPVEHRAFVDTLRTGATVRACIAALVTEEVRAQRSGASSLSAALVSAFNRVIDVVLDFRWQHFQFVRKFVIEQASGGRAATGTGGSSAFTYLHQHVDDTEKAKLSLSALLREARETLGVAPPTKLPLPAWSYPPFRADSAAANEIAVALDSAGAAASDALWVPSVARGFLPSELPRGWDDAPLPSGAPCAALGELLGLIPASASFVPATFAAEVARRRAALAPLATVEACAAAFGTLPRPALARVRMALAWVATALLASDAELSDAAEAPLALRVPLEYTSRRLARPARLCWTDLVSMNARLPPATLLDGEAGGAGESAAGAAPAAAPLPGRLLCRFVAVEEEEALWLTLAAIEGSAGALVGAARDCALAVAGDEADRLATALDALKNSILAVVAAHDPMVKGGKASTRAQKTVMRRVRRLLLAGGCCAAPTAAAAAARARSFSAASVEEAEADGNGSGRLAGIAVAEDLALARWLYVGESPLLPTLWAVLGVQRRAASSLQMQRDAALRAMPRAHRRWVDALAAPDLSLRAFIARRAPALPVHTLALLEDHLAGCLSSLLKLCSRRSQLVCRYLPAIASAFRGCDFAADKAAIAASFETSLVRRRLGETQ